MQGYEIMREIVKVLDEREKLYQSGETQIRIKYQIAKEDGDFCVLKVRLFFPPEHQSQLYDFVFTMFFHEDSFTYNAVLSGEFDSSKHVEALELVNKLNKDYFEDRFLVSDPNVDGLEKIEMKRYYFLQKYSSPEDWVMGIVEFSRTGDLFYSEHLEDILPFY
ncbi:hypothetical protein [Butyrivibrio sp. FCS014]|uniref:hypothetical protein n=1 Tax=Butyrivibrio sp. FCS014 TaxID=1408304 RepID=UPI0004677332|nr:hypothetical protein [Butyrivibrio sp. FCS014]